LKKLSYGVLSMQISRAPLRLSYVGGGTDFPDFFEKYEGAGVVAAAMNKYVYVYHSELAPFSAENFRFTYRETESVLNISEFKHPVLRELLREFDWSIKSNFGTFADLPSGAGLGGSSSFTVCLAGLLSSIKGNTLTPEDLAKFAILIERTKLKEPGGYQDQYISAYGGLRSYSFSTSGVEISSNLLEIPNLHYLNERQVLIWLGKSRESRHFSKFTSREILDSNPYLLETLNLFQWAKSELSLSSEPEYVFRVLFESVREGWRLKKNFIDNNSAEIKEAEIKLEKYGQKVAYKLCGAGGTGFILALAEPDIIEDFIPNFPNSTIIRPELVSHGFQATLGLGNF
jgi:D-glycero-alpha-D-manno-heptose-7-phosphate kinase